MDRKLTRRALQLMDAHEAFVRATVVRASGSVPGKVGATMLVTGSGATYGTVGGAALEETVKELAAQVLVHRRGDLHHFDLQAWKPGGLPSLCGGSVDIALEYVAARPNLLLWGGGHVAKSLADLLPTLEYDFSVADDRAEWVGEERFPQAERREVVPPARLWEVFEPASYTHLYVLGYDAQRDLDVLERSVARFPNFIGLIASSAKRTHMFAELRRRGIGEEQLSRIHTPVGVAIGAESPAEIAVSIVAEIIQGNHAPVERSRAAEQHVAPTSP